MMNKHVVVIAYVCLSVALMARAQVADDDKKRLRADSLKQDYEEWLLHEPQQPVLQDTLTARQQMPELPVVEPEKLYPQRPPVSLVIMTPRLKTDMRLAYQSHWLEEQRKAQQGGAMTIGANPLALLGYLLHKIFPHRKSKKQRKREELQRILDNY